MNYDEMLSQMSLRYFNGKLYQDSKPEHLPQHSQSSIQSSNRPIHPPQPPQSYIYNKYFASTKTPELKTKEEYIRYINYKKKEHIRIQNEQKEKRKLLISATDGYTIKVTTPNSLFKLKY